jgi:hypothetical protein
LGKTQFGIDRYTKLRYYLFQTRWSNGMRTGRPPLNKPNRSVNARLPTALRLIAIAKSEEISVPDLIDELIADRLAIRYRHLPLYPKAKCEAKIKAAIACIEKSK